MDILIVSSLGVVPDKGAMDIFMSHFLYKYRHSLLLGINLGIELLGQRVGMFNY